jgi:hypothetical protein
MTFVSSDATGQVTAGGFVSGVIETGGTCTLSLTRGSAVVTDQTAATPDSSTTQCGDLSIAAAKLTAGTWEATLSYSSSTHHLQSPQTPVLVN